MNVETRGQGGFPEGMLEDKIAVVTDSGKGMGREIAVLMAREGARLVIHDSGGPESGGRGCPSLAEEVAREIRDRGGHALSTSEPIASWAGAHRLIQTSLDHFGRVDILVNNVHIPVDHQGHTMLETKAEDWAAVLRGHLKSSFCCTRAALPYMRAQRQGCLIHFVSAAGLIGEVGQASCGAVSMAVAGFSRNVAIEMERYRVTSNCIAPIPLYKSVSAISQGTQKQEEGIQGIQERGPLDVAPLVVFLASESGRRLSGQIFGVRGREILLFSQSRIQRSIHNSEGWTVERLSGVLECAMRPHFTPMESSDAYFSWDPMI